MDLASFMISFWQLSRRPLWIWGFITCVYKRWMISQPSWYVYFEAVQCDTLYRAVWAGCQWDGTRLAQELLHNVTLLLREEAVLQSLLGLPSQHNPGALLHVQTRPILRKPLSSCNPEDDEGSNSCIFFSSVTLDHITYHLHTSCCQFWKVKKIMLHHFSGLLLKSLWISLPYIIRARRM